VAKPIRSILTSTVSATDTVIPSASLSNQATVQEPGVQWVSAPMRSSESISDAVVAWFGPLSFRSSVLCEVELVSGVTPDYRLTQMSVWIF